MSKKKEYLVYTPRGTVRVKLRQYEVNSAGDLIIEGVGYWPRGGWHSIQRVQTQPVTMADLSKKRLHVSK